MHSSPKNALPKKSIRIEIKYFKSYFVITLRYNRLLYCIDFDLSINGRSINRYPK